MLSDRRAKALIDLAVYGTLGVLGLLQFVMIRKSPDYLNDVNYYELAQSVIRGATYGFNQKPMTQLPPGVPYLMAVLNPILGCSYSAMLHIMTLCTTLGLLLSYKLLSQHIDPCGAGVGCLLLASSPSLFAFSTTLVFADMPYLLVSVILVLGASYLDRRKHWTVWKRLAWGVWGTLLIAVVLIKSVALALLLGLLGWMAISWLRNRSEGTRRIKVFLPLVMMAIAVEVAWMYWAATHQVHEWALPGYQEHYIAQLRLKDANDPELGLATLRDIMVRPILHGDDIAAAVFGVFTHKEMAPAWYSPATVFPLIAVLLGLGYSFRKGGTLLDWYFASYQMMFLFWSWEFERRFFLAIAPLAIVYLWRGGRLVLHWTINRPHLVGSALFALAAGGCASTALWGRHVLHPQFRSCVAIWLLDGVVSCLLFWMGRRRVQGLASQMRLSLPAFGGRVMRSQALMAAATAVLVASGLSTQVGLGLVNRNPNLTKDEFNYPEIEAARWIETHSGSSAVIMARKDDMVYHYSHRRVVWFPPSLDAAVLMDGIRRWHVQYVVVHYGNDMYWKPSAADCFSVLAHVYPESFRLVHAGYHNSIFQVVGRESRS